MRFRIYADGILQECWREPTSHPHRYWPVADHFDIDLTDIAPSVHKRPRRKPQQTKPRNYRGRRLMP